MILHVKRNCTAAQRRKLDRKLALIGATVYESPGSNGRILAVIGNPKELRAAGFDQEPAVSRSIPIDTPYKLANREFRPKNAVVHVGDLAFGGTEVPVIAGPCSVENRTDLLALARAVKKGGATLLRGGAFKPRTSPYSFQGLGEEGLSILAEARQETGLMIVTEVMDTRDVDLVCRYADMLQVGARNIQNFNLLKEVGKAGKPVLLKRGMMTTLKEFLMSAEYILSNGNFDVVLCERGIRSFDTATRNLLDLTIVPLIHHWSHLPVVVDPAHGTGDTRWVPIMARAGIAAGADGLMVEVHQDPENAYSDGDQSLLPDDFASLMKGLRPVAKAIGRKV